MTKSSQAAGSQAEHSRAANSIIGQEVEHLRDDLLSAEFLGATDLADSIGGSLAFMTKLGEIYGAQWRMAASDFQQLSDDIKKQPNTAPAALLEYTTRRAQHRTEGFLQTIAAGIKEQQRFMDAQVSYFELWTRLSGR